MPICGIDVLALTTQIGKFREMPRLKPLLFLTALTFICFSGDESFSGDATLETQGKSLALAVMEKYVAIVNGGNYSELAELFAKDAVFLPPDGSTQTGRDQVRAFYESFLASIRPKVHIASSVCERLRCAIVFAADETGGQAVLLPKDPKVNRGSSLDYVDVNEDGKIVRLCVYLPPVSST